MMKIRQGLFILIFMLISGCSNPQALVSTAFPSGTPSRQIENTDIFPAATNTHIPTPQLLLIPTDTTSFIIPILTPIPTLAGEDAKRKVAYLLETNGNCSLPCWWGITPGRTTWSEAEPYLETFALGISPTGFSKQNDLAFYNAEIPDPNSNSPTDYLFAGFAVNNSGVVEIIDSTSIKSISDTLDNIGVPSQVWVEIISNFGPGPLLFTLALFYNDGVMVVYEGTIYPDNDNFILICPKNILTASSHIWVWNFTMIQTFEDIGKFSSLIAPLSPNRFKLLNNISDMRPQSFFDYYIDPSATQCIKTPLSDWIN
jgi:hypothetical protein